MPDLRSPRIKMLVTSVLRLPLNLLRCSSLKHLVLLFLAVILSEQENLMWKELNIEIWFEISVKLNHFLVRLKPLLPI